MSSKIPELCAFLSFFYKYIFPFVKYDLKYEIHQVFMICFVFYSDANPVIVANLNINVQKKILPDPNQN
jgi:hypothetical protein